MIRFIGRLRPASAIFCACACFALAGGLFAQQQPAAPKPQVPNPFENVPTTNLPIPAAPTPQPQPPTPTQQQQPNAPVVQTPATVEPAAPVDDIIEAIEFRGARRVPQDTLRSMILSRVGDKPTAESLRRDFLYLWNTGRFDDITIQREAGRNGYIIRFIVVERRVIRTIKYDGMKSITVSEILDRFKEKSVGLSVEQQYDPNKVQRAAIILKEYLAERGRQFATVEPELRTIPPTSLEVNFKVLEGPKVKMGSIEIEGNKVFNDRTLRRAMKALRPVGIPHSILLENMFAKAYDANKLEADEEFIRHYYMDRGYFTAKTGETNVTIVDVGGGKFRVPPFYMNKPGKRANVVISVEEGRQYKLNKINFAGVKLFRAPEALMQPIFGMSEGDIFSTEKLRKGMEQIRKLYGEYGYIDMVPEPQPEPIANTDKLDLTLSVDEGKQFFVRRIDFSGNSTTRDKVIRREIVLDEGAIYNTRLWDLSVLRLNQLGFFEPLKENEAADIHKDTRSNTVDITLKLKERGKNSVTLNGGVSGISGSFIGFGYSTNNFLGLGETLSLDSQIGDRIKNVTLGFTEPYLFDRPITTGITLYTQQFNYDQGREVSLLTGRNLTPLYNSLGTNNLLNYVTNGFGGSIFASSPARRLGGIFARVAMSYSYGVQNIKTETDTSRQYFEYINYQGLEGQNSLSGIRTSAVTPSYTYNSVDHPITPSRGKSIFISAQIAGLGGNVRMIAPTIELKWFRPGGLRKGNVIGMHFLGRTITGFGGRVAPPFNRFYMGGENDIRGFDNWGVSPIAYVPNSANVPLLNADGSPRMQRTIIDGVVQNTAVTTPIPIYQTILPGGDTQVVGNLEYRIPIAGPVTLAAFLDAGINKVARPGQLRINNSRVDSLNGLFPQASFSGQAVLAGNTGQMRSSTGLEVQIMMPVVNAPFRLYYAYNPQIVQEFLIPPIVADRSYFPNQISYLRSVALFAQASPFFEKRTALRFTISRTF